MRFFIGPMSKNVVDAVINFNSDIGLIPSRRQVDYDGGYVNNWTTKEFSEYVNGRAIIQRDHGGPNQGNINDDGLESFRCDAKYFDLIHIDPWKHYTNFLDGFEETLYLIKFLYWNNPNLRFEIGTEEAIRRFSVNELNNLLYNLENKLSSDIFNSIEYVVVQSGVGLNLGKQINTGQFDPKRLEKMINVCKRFGKKTKEHNGDYLSVKDYTDRFDLGLDSINIAPQFGQFETSCYLDEMNNDIQDFYQICYESKRWEKWVDKDFEPEKNKKELIQICGHYVLSDQKFIDIKPNIDDKINYKLKAELNRIINA